MIEQQLYKAIHELDRLQKGRCGDNIRHHWLLKCMSTNQINKSSVIKVCVGGKTRLLVRIDPSISKLRSSVRAEPEAAKPLILMLQRRAAFSPGKLVKIIKVATGGSCPSNNLRRRGDEYVIGDFKSQGNPNEIR